MFLFRVYGAIAVGYLFVGCTSDLWWPKLKKIICPCACCHDSEHGDSVSKDPKDPDADRKDPKDPDADSKDPKDPDADSKGKKDARSDTSDQAPIPLKAGYSKVPAAVDDDSHQATPPPKPPKKLKYSILLAAAFTYFLIVSDVSSDVAFDLIMVTYVNSIRTDDCSRVELVVEPVLTYNSWNDEFMPSSVEYLAVLSFYPVFSHPSCPIQSHPVYVHVYVWIWVYVCVCVYV
jgi:hypothetical protein